MRMASIRKYLKKNKIMSRKSTFSAAFASAIAPYDLFETAEVTQAIRDLGQDPEKELECVYCGKEAATWDHVNRRVMGGEYSGYGHRIRNLVPSCRTCNERKSGKPWEVWLDSLNPLDIEVRRANIRNFLRRPSAAPFTMEDMRRAAPEELTEFLDIRKRVFELLERADELADVLREVAGRAHRVD